MGEVSGGCRGFGAWELVLTSTPLLWQVIQQNPRSPEISYSQFVAARGGPMGQVTPGRIERAAEKPSRASKVIGLKGF